MSTEHIVAIVSILGAITSFIAALASVRREEIKARLENRARIADEIERNLAIQESVQEDTVGLYRRLSEQYTAISEKDKNLLRIISFVIRRLIVMERTIADLLAEMEIRWETHLSESENLACPFYSELEEYFYARVSGIEGVVSTTLDEVDTLLFNGTGPYIRDKAGQKKIVEDSESNHKE